MIEKSPLDAYRQAQQRQEAAAMSTANEGGEQISLSDYLVDTTLPFEMPPFSLAIDGVGVIPSGITAVCGKAKNGKTHFLNVIAACLLSEKRIGSMCSTTKLTAPFVWIDTEQSGWEVRLNVNRLFRTIGVDERTDAAKLGLYVYTLRELTVQQKCDAVKMAVDFHRPQFLVIDGVRDLMGDINDQNESIGLAEMLLKMTAALPTMTVISVLHKNDGESAKTMRGAIGTELLNKCNTLFECKKADGWFTVTNVSRQREASPFMFRIDENGDYAALNAADAAEMSTGITPAGVEIAIRAVLEKNPGGLRWAKLVAEVRRELGGGNEKAIKAIIKSINARCPILNIPNSAGGKYTLI